VNERTPEDDLVDVLTDALFEMLVDGNAANDMNEDGDEPQDAA
jgi:hypothetical protein